VHLQALKYAALASRFTADELARAHADFLQARGPTVSVEEARSRLQAHAGPLDDQLLAAPRIVIVAEDYGRVLTTTVLYLLQHGLPITLLRMRPWRLDGRVVVTVTQELPMPAAEDYLLTPEARRQQERVRADEDRRRERRSVDEIRTEGLLEPGTILTFQVPPGSPTDLRGPVEEWLHTDPARGQATSYGDSDQPGQLCWQFDDAPYTPAVLATRIVEMATGRIATVDASRAWLLEDGRNLAAVAGAGESIFRPADELVAAAPADIQRAALGTALGAVAERVTTAIGLPTGRRDLAPALAARSPAAAPPAAAPGSAPARLSPDRLVPAAGPVPAAQPAPAAHRPIPRAGLLPAADAALHPAAAANQRHRRADNAPIDLGARPQADVPWIPPGDDDPHRGPVGPARLAAPRTAPTPLIFEAWPGCEPPSGPSDSGWPGAGVWRPQEAAGDRRRRGAARMSDTAAVDRGNTDDGVACE
jgi:hypothetical protein